MLLRQFDELNESIYYYKAYYDIYLSFRNALYLSTFANQYSLYLHIQYQIVNHLQLLGLNLHLSVEGMFE